MKLYVEGGGDAAALKTACREGFTKFITQAGLAKRPRIVACGSRSDAYESFRTAIANGESAMLLVDSEAPIDPAHETAEQASWLPWSHLAQREGDGWQRPVGSQDMDCHLMAQIMETWFLADRDTLKRFFGDGFKENQLPPIARAIEGVAKTDVYRALEASTRSCKTKSPYGKGDHSFKLLSLIDPAKVTNGSPWAQRFISGLTAKMTD